jgi:hypothetical protein
MTPLALLFCREWSMRYDLEITRRIDDQGLACFSVARKSLKPIALREDSGPKCMA